MRSFEELRHALNVAVSTNDEATLRVLAVELDAVGTEEGRGVAAIARGSAALLAGEHETALTQFNLARSVFEGLGNMTAIARVTRRLGNVYHSMGDLKRSLEHYLFALQIHTEQGNRADESLILSEIGILHFETGEYPEAMMYFRRSQGLQEELQDHVGLAYTNGNLGNVFAAIGEYAQALECMYRALDLQQEYGDRAGVAHITGNIGIVFLETKDHARALDYYERALRLFEEVGDREGVARITGNIGAVHLHQRDEQKAMQYLDRAIQMFKEFGERTGLVAFMGGMATALIRTGNLDKAEQLLDEQAAITMDDPQFRAEHHGNRSEIAVQRGDMDRALEHLQAALTITKGSGRRSLIAEYHLLLRDLAQKRADFNGFIEHNAEYLRITEEIRGQESMRKLAMLEAEKKIEAERQEHQRHKALLYNTLPKSIADRVLRGEAVNDSIENASVLFMDMVGFTSLSLSLPPDDVVKLLSAVFTLCDQVASTHGMMKIKTIGDSYMAAALEGDVVFAAATTAVELRRRMQEQFPHVQVRIGIHCGPVTAGVIGTERLQYDVWGDTVNVASRMESSGEPGRIHVSEAFATALQSVDGGRIGARCAVRGERHSRHPGESRDPDNDSFNDSMTLLKRGEVTIKGKGPMTTYWLSARVDSL